MPPTSVTVLAPVAALSALVASPRHGARDQRGAVEALLRKEGIYSSLLTSWRKQIARHGSDGLAAVRRGRPVMTDAKDRRIAELEKKAARLEARLRLAEGLLDLQKKPRRSCRATR